LKMVIPGAKIQDEKLKASLSRADWLF